MFGIIAWLVVIHVDAGEEEQGRYARLVERRVITRLGDAFIGKMLDADFLRVTGHDLIEGAPRSDALNGEHVALIIVTEPTDHVHVQHRDDQVDRYGRIADEVRTSEQPDLLARERHQDHAAIPVWRGGERMGELDDAGCARCVIVRPVENAPVANAEVIVMGANDHVFTRIWPGTRKNTYYVPGENLLALTGNGPGHADTAKLDGGAPARLVELPLQIRQRPR